MARRALLAKCHIAKKELGLDDSIYREVLARVTGHDSASKLSDKQLVDALDEFRRLGWQPRTSDRPAPRSQKPHVRKVWAVWGALKRSGAVRSPTKAALRAFVQKMTGVTDPEWLSPDDANKVIEGLKAWLARHGKGAA
jgi:phage gp16-like protein